ncbi:serine/threonine-protein kinase [Streptomyces arenae]|uniref:serine/threonine-protein kinase n=1 Tax=Streptomyces arenae TaxID=29301 RepID=UPI002657CFBE|nr:serine/threonine-protein kinase [Streptomyces arenae]MCG7204265.1 serine/threonine protein kinase [Streptomyces arenae]
MGEVFAGRYELADPIGHGGVGAVWRAWDHRRKRYVAAKVLQQSDAHALLRFVREQALRIDHPHVLAPASWAADDDKVLFTMDLVAGGSLVHLVGDYGPLPPSFVCVLLDQLLSGLGAVHAEGVVHRDIKPANILLEATGTARPRLRLSDFGIAMRLGEARLTETNLVVGTPGYIAPEQLLGAEPDFTADLFAVGLVALYLLEGAKPDAKSLVQYFAEHGTPGAPKGIPDPLWQVVANLLQPDPRARFHTATGARRALAEARELLPETDADDESIEIFDQLGPLPEGFGPSGPARPASGVDARQGATGTGPSPGSDTRTGTTYPTGPATPSYRAPASTESQPGTGGGQGAPPVAGTGQVPASMSDTGSFRLPPPQPPTPPKPYAGQQPQPQPLPQEQPQAQPLDRQRAQPLDRWEPLAQPQSPPLPLPPSQPRPEQSAGAPWPPAQPLPPARTPDADGTTATYTARDPQSPPPATRTHGRRRRRVRRAGPPARAAVPILLLALACYAVGFWALTRV